MSNKTETGCAILGCSTPIIILLFNLVLGGICTEYVVEFWGSYLTGKQVDVPFLVCAFAGLFLGQFTIPGAVFTWLLSFVLAAK